MQSSDKRMRVALIRVKISNPGSFPSFRSPPGPPTVGSFLWDRIWGSPSGNMRRGLGWTKMVS
jgi:hypothetical protein